MSHVTEAPSLGDINMSHVKHQHQHLGTGSVSRSVLEGSIIGGSMSIVTIKIKAVEEKEEGVVFLFLLAAPPPLDASPHLAAAISLFFFWGEKLCNEYSGISQHISLLAALLFQCNGSFGYGTSLLERANVVSLPIARHGIRFSFTVLLVER